MKTSTTIKKLNETNFSTAIEFINNNFKCIEEKLDKNIRRFVFNNDTELHSVTVYGSCNMVCRISYNPKFN
jgi:hypothetical protein